MRVLLGITLWALMIIAASAHEVRPAYLNLTETNPSEFAVTWKQPVLDGKRLKIKPTFPQGCTQTTPIADRKGVTITERSVLSCPLTEGTICLLYTSPSPRDS